MIEVTHEEIAQYVLKLHRKAVEDPKLTPEQFIRVGNLHLTGKCEVGCIYCEFDRAAEAYIILRCMGVKVEA